jgi:hypothetical protein
VKYDTPISKERGSREDFYGCRFPDKEIEEHLSSSGRVKEEILWVEVDLPTCGLCREGVGITRVSESLAL